MLTWLAKAKSFGWMIAAAGLAFLAAVVRIKTLRYQRDKARFRAKKAEGQLSFNADVDAAETEIENEFSDRRERAKQDRENGKIPHNLRDSSDW